MKLNFTIQQQRSKAKGTAVFSPSEQWTNERTDKCCKGERMKITVNNNKIKEIQEKGARKKK